MRGAFGMSGPFRPNAGKRLCIGQMILVIIALALTSFLSISSKEAFLSFFFPSFFIIIIVLEFVATPLGILTFIYFAEKADKKSQRDAHE